MNCAFMNHLRCSIDPCFFVSPCESFLCPVVTQERMEDGLCRLAAVAITQNAIVNVKRRRAPIAVPIALRRDQTDGAFPAGRGDRFSART